MIINRTELTASAIKFFALQADPFDVDRIPAIEEMFADQELNRVAARLADAVLYKRFVCVSGAVGTGKTLMKIRIARELKKYAAKNGSRVYLLYPEFFDMHAVGVSAIAAHILEEFDIKPPRDSTARVRKIRRHLMSLEQTDARVTLVFDECHRLNPNVLTSLKNFWEMTDGGYARLLGIVLFGQPKFIDTILRDYAFREIAERVQVIEMPSIERSAKEYLAHRLALVGGTLDKLFDAESVCRICRLAKTPLSLGNLANYALMEAYRVENPQVQTALLNLPDAAPVRRLRRASSKE